MSELAHRSRTAVRCRRVVVSLAMTCSLFACGGGDPSSPALPPPPPPPPPPTATVASVRLSSTSARLAPDDTMTVTATPLDAAGNALSSRTVLWTTSAPTIATVSTGGRITALEPGDAVIEATVEGVKAQLSVNVALVALQGTSIRAGTVTLPSSATFARNTLRVHNSFGTGSVTTTGGFTVISYSSGPQLTIAESPSGRPLLMGWLDAQHTVLSARTTAEVLAYFDLGAAWLPSAARAAVITDLAKRTELNALATAIANAISGDTAVASLDVPAVHAARKAAQTLLLPSAQTAAALRMSVTARSSIVRFDVLGPQSGVDPNEIDLNIIKLTNQYRRRVVALLDRQSFVAANGTVQNARSRSAREELAPVFGVQTLGGVLGDLILGNMAWQPIESSPMPTPVFPADARSTTYRLLVLGSGYASDKEISQLAPIEQEELRQVVGKAFFVDLVVPVVSNMILAGDVAGDAIDHALSSGAASALISDFVNLLFITAPEAWSKLYAGDTRGATQEVMTALFSTDALRVLAYETVALIAFAISKDPHSVVRMVKISDFGKAAEKFVGRVDLLFTATDIALQGYHSGVSRAIETWTLTVVPSKVSINPPSSSIGVSDVQLLKAIVHGLEALTPGAALQFKWTTTGRHGKLYDANHRQGATQFVSSSDAVTYTPNLLSSGTDDVSVEVTRVQSGASTVDIGNARATVEVRGFAISLTPEAVTLKGGDRQTFTVSVPSQLAGTAVLTYRWETTGNFGTLDRGSKTVLNTSRSMTYTSRSASRGEDEVIVQVLAQSNGVTTSLGVDRALVRIEREPFTLEPAFTTAPVDSLIRFVARPHGDVPTAPKYLWRFGDGTEPLTTGADSTVSHRFANLGSYLVTVDMLDGSGIRLATASATASIGDYAFVQISKAVGGLHTCGITPSGEAWCWGRNNKGQLGDGTTTSRSRPVRVSGGQRFTRITAGAEHTCALTAQGAAWCWGDHVQGQTGDGTEPTGFNTPPKLTPVRVAGSQTFASISAGVSTTCAVTTAGRLWCWGHTTHRQIDDGPGSYRTAPVAVLANSVVRHVGTGWQSCATTSALTYCWGDNGRDSAGIGAVDYGQPGSDILGTGAGAVRSVFPPAPVIGASPLWSGIAVGAGFICAHALPAGPLSCWGVNGFGQLGDGTTQFHSAPTSVSDTLAFTAVGAGTYHACGLSVVGDVWCWGRNHVGQLGTGNTVSSSVPVKVATAFGPFVSLSVGSVGTCAIAVSGITWCWGNNSAGELGDGTQLTRLAPVKISP